MPDTDFQTDPMLRLLTDALRAGPASPEWREAVATIGPREQDASDEHQLLIKARQYLESGREWRSIRAGPGFTNKLLTSLESTSVGARRVPTASLIAVVSAVVVVGILALAGWMLLHGTAVPTTPQIEALAARAFVNPLMAARFDGAIPAGWKTVGALQLEARDGLRIVPSQTIKDPSGGAAIWTGILDPGVPVVIEAVIKPGRQTAGVIAELVITDTPEFDAQTATTPHAFTWLLQGWQTKLVLPDGRIAAQGDRPRNFGIVRVTVDAGNAIVDLNGRRFWAGAHELDAKKPRSIVLRMLRNGSDKDATAIESVRVLTSP